MRKLFLIACACLVLSLSSSTPAAPITLTFDERPTQPVNNVGNVSGVTFSFTVGGLLSPDARYNAIGPGDFTFLQGAVLEGDAAGVLTLNFAAPTSLLRFGVGLSTADSLSPGFTVQLFDPALNSLGVTSVSTNPLIFISEGQFSYLGVPIRRAVIDFNENFTPFDVSRRFALDNLTFEPIPEPTTLVLLGTGLAGIGTAVRKRRRG